MKTFRFILLIIVISIIIFIIFSGANCANKNEINITNGISFDKNRAFSYLEYQVEAGYRIPGTKTHIEIKDWIVSTLEEAGADSVTTQDFIHISLSDGSEVPMYNIIADFSASSNAGNAKNILIGAHWDTRPRSEKDLREESREKPLSGANDGASGVAVLLELANQLSSLEFPCNVRLIFFDGEDYGYAADHGQEKVPFEQLDEGEMFLGSKYFAVNCGKDIPDFAIIVDMVGKKGLCVYREPYSEEKAKEVNDKVFLSAKKIGYMDIEEPDDPRFVNRVSRVAIVDDHIPLLKVGIPSICIIDFDYFQWHTQADTVETCSPDSLDMVGKVLIEVIQNGG